MDKRYQVFVSSTFQDLEPARQEVSQALLKADCFPAGMELFPAADEEQFEYIKQIIAESDYYIIISAGRYGSIHPETGLSYTEMEYDFALEIGVPVIRLLHKDPMNELRGEHIERTDDGKAKLTAFRDKLKAGRLANFWSDPSQLGQLVVFGLMDARKRHPRTGWVRADGRATEEAEREIVELKREVAELELKLERAGKSVDPVEQIRNEGVRLLRERLTLFAVINVGDLEDDLFDIMIFVLSAYYKNSDQYDPVLPHDIRGRFASVRKFRLVDAEDIFQCSVNALEALGFLVHEIVENDHGRVSYHRLSTDGRKIVAGMLIG